MRIKILSTVAALTIFGAFLQTVSSQSNAESEVVQPVAATISIRAAGHGDGTVNFNDGRDLSVSGSDRENPNAANGGALKVLAAADFNSDGVQDLAAADADGKLKIYAGNADAVYPHAEAANENRVRGAFSEESFFAARTAANLSFTPDFLLAGDYNADGFSDLLAARRGDNCFYLLAGDGRGDFAAVQPIKVSGAISAVETGEIGRADGQTDVAVAVSGRKGASLLIYENPEGAFKHQPEIFKLTAAISELAIGELDGDSYGDVVAAGGNTLKIVHGRGQAYPFDLLETAKIKRPAAAVETARMPFQISALTVGKFTGGQPKNELAVLTTGGTIEILYSPENRAAKRTLSPDQMESKLKLPTFSPGANAGTKTGGQRRFAAVADRQPQSAEEAAQRGLAMADSSLRGEKLQNYLREKAERAAADFAKLPKAERTRRKTQKLEESVRQAQTARDSFGKSLAAKPTAPLAAWNRQTLAADARLVSAANSPNRSQKLVVARVSGSDNDALILPDGAGRQIQLVTPSSAENGENSSFKIQNSKSEIVSFDVEGGAPTAVLPLRLNADNISDFVVLRENSALPAIVKSAAAQTFTVNSTGDGDICRDDGECTLRGAIRRANDGSGADFINFNIAGDGVKTILPTSDQLPLITDAVTIDATTQPGYAGKPLIEISGANLSGAKAGLGLSASNSVIRGFAVSGFTSATDEETNEVFGGDGIVIFSTNLRPNVSNNIIEANFLGTDASGGLRRGNEAAGVLVFDSDANLIGGRTAQARNILSGNQKIVGQNTEVLGVGVQIEGGDGNGVKGNYIGLDAGGAFSVPNYRGVVIGGKNNLLGGSEAGAGNVISGNGSLPQGAYNLCSGQGVSIFDLVDPETFELLTDNTAIIGNRIGTNYAGTIGVGNCSQGISTSPLARTFIGSITERGRNLVSGNHYDAIWCALSSDGDCTIVGNDVGTDVTGTQAIPNDEKNGCVGFCMITDTIWISPGENATAIVGSSGGTTPGGDCTGFCNLVAGNYTYNSASNPNGSDSGGILRTGLGFAGIFNNYAGTTRNGAAQLSNFNGVAVIYGNFTAIGESYTDENGAQVSLGNLLSGNNCLGASVGDSFNNSIAAEFYIRANLIGTDAGGERAIPNSPNQNCTSPGLSVNSSASLMIVGGTSASQRNVISGNGYNGLEIGAFGSGAVGVFNNYIGTSKSGAPLGNGRDGVSAQNGGGVISVGGTGENEGNRIKNNLRIGVFVPKYQSSPNEGVRIVGNSISENGALGIDLSNVSNFPYDPDGVTVNDCFDEDAGANGLQNYPELFALTVENGATVVPVVLRSSPARNFTVDFYANNQIDPTKYGEGEIYIGAVRVRTDGNGFAAFKYILPSSISQSQKITATATDENGSTSEFSCAAGECTAATGKNFQDAIDLAAAGITCVQPLVVNVNTDEPDADIADGVCDTDTSVEGLQCSLRAAIQEANARRGYDAINFNIPGGGVQTIGVQTALPPISERVTLDASTQPGYSDSPIVVIRRGDAEVPEGLIIQTSDSYINALAVNGFSLINIGIGNNSVATNNNRIESCFIGINADGLTIDETRSGSLYNVIIAGNSKNNRIGGEVAANGNVISGASYNVALNGANVQNNRVVNNKIGTNKTGTAKLSTPSSQGTGIQLTNGATKNTVGGSLEDGGNLISGHINAGIAFENANGNTVTGNLIGTDSSPDADLAAAIPNNTGIALGFSSNESGGSNNVIGGAGNLRNVISGNRNGIFINKISGGNKIAGNYIGTNKNGLFALANTANGIYMIGSNNTVGGDANAPNVISGNGETGVIIAPLTANSSGEITGNTISDNIIGVDSSGSETLGGFTPTQPQGIVIRGASQTTVENNTVARNTISANTLGVVVSDFTAGNTISDNRIGTNKDGTNAVGNKIGISLVRTRDNTVRGNQISGNAAAGLFVGSSNTTLETGSAKENARLAELLNAPVVADDVANTENNSVTGNLIGTNAAGDQAIGNGGFGVFLGERARDNKIGGRRSQNEGNTISGHANGDGVFIGTIANDLPAERQPSGNIVQGNRLGMQATGDGCLSNKNAVFISEAHDNLIGSDDSDDDDYGNFIGCSLEDAILISGADAARNSVRYNFVGTLENGASTGNLKNGITIDGASGTKIEGNTIGNSGGDGISIQNVPTPTAPRLHGRSAANEDDGLTTLIAGNSIGVRAVGDSAAAIVNRMNGVHITNSSGVVVGVLANSGGAVRKNIISANDAAGVLIEGADSQNNLIINNIIGTDEAGAFGFGNNGDGVLITAQSSRNQIGGAQTGAGNKIVANGGAGVRIDASAGNSNLADLNEIYENAGLGIEIGALGIQPNDLHDADEGANRGQNYPQLNHSINSADQLVVNFKVDSAPENSAYGADGLYVEFFKADGRGQGERFLGFAYYQAGDYHNGSPQFKEVNLGDINDLNFAATDKITATATDADGNTSEFTPIFAPTAANVTVAGQVKTANGRGIAGARLTLTGADGKSVTAVTNSFGNFKFGEIKAGATYVISVAAKRYSFAPQVVSVTDNLSGLQFNARR